MNSASYVDGSRVLILCVTIVVAVFVFVIIAIFGGSRGRGVQSGRAILGSISSSGRQSHEPDARLGTLRKQLKRGGIVHEFGRGVLAVPCF